jgi:hypothetical protein
VGGCSGHSFTRVAGGKGRVHGGPVLFWIVGLSVANSVGQHKTGRDFLSIGDRKE